MIDTVKALNGGVCGVETRVRNLVSDEIKILMALLTLK